MILPGKIISGGQTGVDRAALDFAKERGIEHSGWAPKGWKAEDGTIPEEHRAFMRETVSADYWPRTVFNVNNSTATLIVYDSRSPMSPGTTKTSHYAGGLIDADGRSIYPKRKGPPRQSFRNRVCIDLNYEADRVVLNRWLATADLSVLNIAGPRESKAPGIYEATLTLLREVWP